MNANSIITAVLCAAAILLGTLACGADSVYALRGVERMRLEVPAQPYWPVERFNGYAREADEA